VRANWTDLKKSTDVSFITVKKATAYPKASATYSKLALADPGPGIAGNERPASHK
jgi:hypothetical protein